jgi:hypothetical protein
VNATVLFQALLVATAVGVPTWFVVEAVMTHRARRAEERGAVQAAMRQCREYERQRKARVRR